jgi:hypothetical protein
MKIVLRTWRNHNLSRCTWQVLCVLLRSQHWAFMSCMLSGWGCPLFLIAAPCLASLLVWWCHPPFLINFWIKSRWHLRLSCIIMSMAENPSVDLEFSDHIENASLSYIWHLTLPCLDDSTWSEWPCCWYPDPPPAFEIVYETFGGATTRPVLEVCCCLSCLRLQLLDCCWSAENLFLPMLSLVVRWLTNINMDLEQHDRLMQYAISWFGFSYIYRCAWPECFL